MTRLCPWPLISNGHRHVTAHVAGHRLHCWQTNRAIESIDFETGQSLSPRGPRLALDGVRCSPRLTMIRPIDSIAHVVSRFSDQSRVFFTVAAAGTAVIRDPCRPGGDPCRARRGRVPGRSLAASPRPAAAAARFPSGRRPRRSCFLPLLLTITSKLQQDEQGCGARARCAQLQRAESAPRQNVRDTRAAHEQSLSPISLSVTCPATVSGDRPC